VRSLSEPPIVMGHGFGALIAQLLIDRGLGAVGVAIGSIAPKGIGIRALATGLALLPALAHPFDHHGTFALSFRRFWRVFCNTLPESEARRAYEAQAVPASRRPLFQVALASVTPGAATAVNFRNSARSPLLLIGGREDVIAPPALGRTLFHKYRASPCVADYREFPGRSHYIIAEQGWQEVADYALSWALAHARVRT
jgi:pimeloyl-ACP methyl ester carboxylesterase